MPPPTQVGGPLGSLHIIMFFQAAGQRGGRLGNAALLQLSAAKRSRIPRLPPSLGNTQTQAVGAAMQAQVFPSAQTLGSQWGCETLQLFPTIHKLPIPSLETSSPHQPGTCAASFLPNPFYHPFLPRQAHPSLPTCPLVDTGAGLAGPSQRADLQGILAASQQPIEEEGGGARQEGHVPHQGLGVAVPQGQAVPITLAVPVCPGCSQRGRAPTAAQAQVADS